MKWCERIPGDLHIFYNIDTVAKVDNSTMFPKLKFLNSLNICLAYLSTHSKVKVNTCGNLACGIWTFLLAITMEQDI